MNKFFFSLTLMIILFYACSDPTSIGAEILENEDLKLDYTDTVQLTMKTVTEKSVRTINSFTNMIGKLEDPVFGETECVVYMNSSFSVSNPNFESARLDSIIMVLPLDTSGYYGELNTSHTIEVFQLTETLTTTIDNIGLDSLFSDEVIPIDEANLIGSVTTVPNYVDSVSFYNPDLDAIDKAPAHIRIPIDMDFGQYYLDNDTLVSSDSIFREEIRGFAIKSTPEGSSALGFNLGGSINQKLFFYYNKPDFGSLVYGFDIGETSFQYYNHTFSSEIENAIDLENTEKLYSGSMAGPNIEIDLSPLFIFQDVLVNHATLDIYINEEGDDLVSYPPTMFLLAYVKTQNGNFEQISDIDLSSFVALENSFGGVLIEDEITGKKMYSFQITSHIIILLNDLLDESIGESIFLRPLQKSQRPFRTVIHGSDGSEFQPRLKLVITNP